MTAAERRVKYRDRNREVWRLFNAYPLYGFKLSFEMMTYCQGEGIKRVTGSRNGNKRLITYLNRTARADHMKRHGKTPKKVKTIRQMYLESKNN